jgi:hypothetical protein
VSQGGASGGLPRVPSAAAPSPSGGAGLGPWEAGAGAAGGEGGEEGEEPPHKRHRKGLSVHFAQDGPAPQQQPQEEGQPPS